MQRWTVDVAKNPLIELRTQRIGFTRVEASAPIMSGVLTSGDGVTLQLEIDLMGLKTSTPGLQGMARSLVGDNDARILQFHATGHATTDPWIVHGEATAGDVALDLQVYVTLTGGTAELTGTVVVPEVDIPLPFMGKMRNFTFDVRAKLPLVG